MGKFKVLEYLPISSKGKIDIIINDMIPSLNTGFPVMKCRKIYKAIKRPTLKKYFKESVHRLVLEYNRLNLDNKITVNWVFSNSKLSDFRYRRKRLLEMIEARIIHIPLVKSWLNVLLKKTLILNSLLDIHLLIMVQ